jgi:bromodomain-containing protein 7/9
VQSKTNEQLDQFSLWIDNVSKIVFSSHGPSYDSTFATMTKEETELVCNNSDASSLESVINLSRNVDYSTFVGDHLLDILTNNEHRSNSKYAEEEKKLREEENKWLGKNGSPAAKTTEDDTSAVAAVPVDLKVDFESLKSLSDVGIDVSFLDSLQEKYQELSDNSNIPLQNLTDTASLIGELKDVQYDRLSASLPLHFSQIVMPNDHEMALASQIQSNLVEMAKHVTPGDVVPNEAIRRALGISIDINESRKNMVKIVEKVAPAVVTVQEEVVQKDEFPGLSGETEIIFDQSDIIVETIVN